MMSSSKLSKKYLILALSTVIVVFLALMFIYPHIYLNLRYKFFPPTNQKQCAEAGGLVWDDNSDNGPLEPIVEDGPSYCMINGKTFTGGGWGNF